LVYCIQYFILEYVPYFINSHILVVIVHFDLGSDTNSERPQKQKKFWSYIKNMKKGHTGVAPLRNNGLLINDSKQKAEVLNIQYHSVFTPLYASRWFKMLVTDICSRILQHIHVSDTGL
jgi:hypothetical protein